MYFSKEQLEKLKPSESLKTESDKDLIDLAFNVLKRWAKTKTDFFCLLAATNLLNALIKRPETKKRLSYSFKRYLADQLKSAIRKGRTDMFDSIHYDGNCFYIRCFSLHFSFHNLIADKDFIKFYLASGIDSNEQWDGIRLQSYAEIIFKTAIKLKSLPKEERFRSIQKLKQTFISAMSGC